MGLERVVERCEDLMTEPEIYAWSVMKFDRNPVTLTLDRVPTLHAIASTETRDRPQLEDLKSPTEISKFSEFIPAG